MACVTYSPSTVRSSVADDVLTAKLLVEVAVPAPVVTVIFPVVAPVGTVVVIWVALATVKVATVPLNLTDVAPVKPVPVMVTPRPICPVVGLKDAMVGVEGVTVKLLAEVAVPPEVVTVILPVVAAAGTVVVI